VLEYLNLSGLDRLGPPLVALLLASRLPNLRTLDYDQMIQAWIYSVEGIIHDFYFKRFDFLGKSKRSRWYEYLKTSDLLH
jgi:hypothetical protein